MAQGQLAPPPLAEDEARPHPARAGRKRDASRDGAILEETLAVLAEAGYQGLTIDKVAARVGAGRATLYRRWPTKADLVLAAVQHLSEADADMAHLPDTGSLRGDMVAMVLPLDDAEQDFRTRVLAAVASLAFAEEPRLAQAGPRAGLGPWTAAIETLIRRAVERGEFPPADVATLAQVIPMACLARAVTREPITAEFSLAMIDAVVIPAMRGGH